MKTNRNIIITTGWLVLLTYFNCSSEIEYLYFICGDWRLDFSKVNHIMTRDISSVI